jgi:hypothetical protein
VGELMPEYRFKLFVAPKNRGGDIIHLNPPLKAESLGHLGHVIGQGIPDPRINLVI